MQTIISSKVKYVFITVLFLPYLLFSQNKKTPEIGVVLQGGGALGLAHIGVLQVLEELEIPIDRIGGTSMGGLVGGLYAVGYTPAQLEQFAEEMDWSVMIGNDIDRIKAPYSARSEHERFIFSATREGTKVGLDYALIDGTNIYQKMQELCMPALNIRNFENLETPFYCVAADLDFGEQVILDRGYLPDVLRSTMAIPLVFNPVKMDDMLLVDGGMFNNFPANEMREKGADLVIGVRLLGVDSIDQIGLVDVLGRSFGSVMEKVRCEYEGECDICIDVALPGLNPSDFNKADELIKCGRIAAEKMAIELKKYKRENYIKRKTLIAKNDKTIINEISINGNKFIKKEKIKNILQLPVGQPIEFSDIQESMEKLQATNLFESMRYRIEKEGQQNILKLFLEEKNKDYFKIGLRYDNDFGASLLLNATFRHIIVGGDNASIEGRLNRNPYFKANYIYRSLKKYTPFFTATLKGDDYFSFTEENDYDIFQHNQFELRSGLQGSPINSMQIKTGLEWQWYGFNFNADQNLLKPYDEHLLNYFLEINIDQLDKTYHPTTGVKAYINSKFITPSISNFSDADKNIWLSAGFFQMFPFGEKAAGKLSANMGISTGYIDPQFLFYQGGLHEHQRSNFSKLPGLILMRNNAQNIANMGYAMRLEVKDNHHIETGYHISNLNNELENIFDGKWQQGVYLGYSFATIIGPLKIQAGFPLDDFDVDVFISAGHNF